MKFWILMGVLLPLGAFSAGGTVENGGDTIYCGTDFSGGSPEIPGTHPPHQPPRDWKLFSRDYVAGLMTGIPAESYVHPDSWTNSFNRIRRILVGAAPKLEKGFVDFAESLDPSMPKLFSSGVEPTTRVWEAVRVNPIHRPYRFIWERKEDLPPNCKVLLRVDGAILGFSGYERTVIRRKGASYTVYSYFEDSMRMLNENAPLQYSMLLVHEWLWDHTASPAVNRRVNIFLHSREINSLSERQIRGRLKKMGIKF